jgi:serine/threonine protein kinase
MNIIFLIGKTQSEWPEYAVKIIDAKKVLEYHYELSVLREMAVLQVLVYPGIARLISAFQYHGSAFLVLEYAKHGDLHSHLVKYGKLESALLR